MSIEQADKVTAPPWPVPPTTLLENSEVAIVKDRWPVQYKAAPAQVLHPPTLLGMLLLVKLLLVIATIENST